MNETVSARLSGEGTNILKLVLNLNAHHAQQYDIANKPFVTVKICGKDQYIATFHAQKQVSSHPWKTQEVKKNGKLVGAKMQLEPTRFKIIKTEPIPGVVLRAEARPEGFVFELVAENFVTAKREVLTIKTKQDKIDAGFAPNSAWGEQVDTDSDAAIVAKREQHMFRKYGGKRP